MIFILAAIPVGAMLIGLGFLAFLAADALETYRRNRRIANNWELW